MRRLGLLTVMCVIATMAPARPAPVGCSWPAKLNQDTFNFAYPDTSATYWAAHFPFVEGARLVIRGTYPHARYFSFHAYDEVQRPVDSIADLDIAPDDGSINPFTSKQRVPDDRRAYTVYVEFTASPAKRAQNTVYAGQMTNGQRNPAGFVIYRTYTPDDPASPEGSVPLPTITLETSGGVVALEFGTCEPLPPDAGGGVNDAIRDSDHPELPDTGGHHPASTNPPTFKRFYGMDQFPRDFTGSAGDDSAEAQSEGGFLSNQQIAYLYAYTSREYGDILVMRGKAPTFPDTRAGDSVILPRQVRYWSVCQNNGLTQRVTDCSADHQTVVGRDGYYTVVVSDPSDRPNNATARNGYTWLAWGGAYVEGIVIYRHMLPSSRFAEAIQNVKEGERPAPVMGEFYPRAVYCDRATFEAGGWRACFK